MSLRLRQLEKMRHPHVVRYYINSLDNDDADITVIMEAWGVSVSSLIARKQHCGSKHIASFAAQVLRALIGLHSVGIAHGDIKPGNILLSNNVYKVCDVDEEATGSAYYMSQARARRHPCPSPEDTFSDTYALGMCVLEVLTGRQPYSELDNQCVVFARVCAGQPPLGWSARSRLVYDKGSEELIEALFASDDLSVSRDARACPSELLALVQLLCSNNEL
jgi:serine/threonine protein kinase